MIASKKKKEGLILESGLKVFRQHGFYEAKIADIAEDAGVAKGTVYQYFDSKQQLFEESIIYIMDKYLEEVEEILKIDQNIKEKLILFAKHHGSFIENYAINQGIANSHYNKLSEKIFHKIIETRDKIHYTIDNLIKEGIEKGEIKKDVDKKVITLTLCGAIVESYREEVFFQKNSSKSVDAEAIINVVFQGIEKKS